MAHESSGSEQVDTEELLATEYHAAAGVAITLGHSELAFLALARAMGTARVSGSDLHHATAVNSLFWIYRRLV